MDPKKRIRRKRKGVDSAFKPEKRATNSDSEDEYTSDTPPRRNNPKRSASTIGDGSRLIYNEGRATEPGGGRKPATQAPRKRARSNSTGDAPSEVLKTTDATVAVLTPSSSNDGKPSEAKTGWFFTRVFQGMRNFLTKSELPIILPEQNDIDKESLSNKQTVAYDANASEITPDPEITKKKKMYYYNEAWHIPADQIEILGSISSGTYGDVSRARWKGSEVAVKTLRNATTTNKVGDKVLNLFLKEVSILSKLQHPSIVLFMGASITPKLCIVMEYISGGSLYSFLHCQKERFEYAQCIRMALEIAEGLNYLHECSPRIIHRDIKSSNILVTSTKSIKIADFGISKETTIGSDSTMTGFMGTSSYMSPEMIRGVRYTEKVDIYSFGVLLCEMYSQKIPFKSLHAIQVAHKILQGARPEIPEKCPASLRALLISCWHETPAERPSFKEIIQILSKLKSV